MHRGPRLDNDIIGRKAAARVDFASLPLFAQSVVSGSSTNCEPPAHIGDGVDAADREQLPSPAPKPVDVPLPRPADPPERKPAVVSRSSPNPERRAWIRRACETIGSKLAALALERGERGVTAIDTAALARAAGIETGEEKAQRARSWHAHAPRSAGLVSDGPSGIYSDTGNNLTRYLHPDVVARRAQREGAAA